METVKNLLFQDQYNQPKLETAKNLLFQDHCIHQPKEKLVKISSFKMTTRPSQGRNC